jgi:hypothetical protein
VVKKKKMATKVTLTGSEPATVTAKLGKARLGSATATKTGGLVLKISKAAASKLAKKKKATIKLDATVAFGSPARASGRLK